MPAAEEAAGLATETGQPYMLGIALATQAKIAALRGRFGQAEELAAEAERLGTPVGARPVLATAQHARALAALGTGRLPAGARPAAAHARHGRSRPPDGAELPHGRRPGRRGQPHRGPGGRGRRAGRDGDGGGPTTSPSLHDGLRFARAVLARPAGGRGAVPRGARRWTSPAARSSGPAPSSATASGSAGSAGPRSPGSTCARPATRSTRWAPPPGASGPADELRAAGERSGERPDASSDILTAQELQIAQLAADGLTNREIGKRLYISHRTVGAHLAKIYAKLGVTSRVQLHDALLR